MQSFEPIFPENREIRTFGMSRCQDAKVLLDSACRAISQQQAIHSKEWPQFKYQKTPAGFGTIRIRRALAVYAYLMNNISRYVGSGQRSSATIPSNSSATLRTSSMAGTTSSRKCFAS